MSFTKHIIAFLLILLMQNMLGQEYEPPATRMPGNLVDDFIRMHIVYPGEAVKNDEQGVVIISYNINKEGKITHTGILRSVSPSVDSAAIRLFRLILWKPAKKMGKPVNGHGEFKIKYNIKRYRSLVRKRGYDTISFPGLSASPSLKVCSLKDVDKAPVALIDPKYKSVQDFITANLVMPEAAIKLHLIGVVKLRFVVETNGLPSNIMVIEPLGGGCTEEAVRVVQLIRWKPAVKNNQAVRCCYNLSFKFEPPDEIKNKNIVNQSNSGI
ncbi:MAG: energy transducer TonB [Chlorobi bacterium]|nr:energy transducer TonB [Chlorobiota bacterium]